MEETKTKKKGAVKKVLFSILGAILMIAIVSLCVFANLLRTLVAVKTDYGNGFYSVEYKENYKLDELLAQGGVSNEDELVQYILKTMLKGLPINVPYEVPKLACSTFEADQKDGGCVFGRNYDNLAGDCMVVKTEPKNGYKSLSVVSLSFLGYTEESTPDSLTNRIRVLATPYFPLDGVNEKGLAVGVLQLFAEPTNQQTDKVDVDTTLAIRVLLDKAATVEEAIKLLESFDMHASANGCYHLHIADATGDSAIVSYVKNEMVVTRNEDLNYQCATNFYVHDVDFEYEAHGQDRYDIIMKGLKKAEGKVSLDEAMELLAQAAQKETVFKDGSICRTQWSSIYDLKNPSLTIANDMDYENVHHFTLD